MNKKEDRVPTMEPCGDDRDHRAHWVDPARLLLCPGVGPQPPSCVPYSTRVQEVFGKALDQFWSDALGGPEPSFTGLGPFFSHTCVHGCLTDGLNYPECPIHRSTAFTDPEKAVLRHALALAKEEMFDRSDEYEEADWAILESLQDRFKEDPDA